MHCSRSNVPFIPFRPFQSSRSPGSLRPLILLTPRIAFVPHVASLPIVVISSARVTRFISVIRAMVLLTFSPSSLTFSVQPSNAPPTILGVFSVRSGRSGHCMDDIGVIPPCRFSCQLRSYAYAHTARFLESPTAYFDLSIPLTHLASQVVLRS